MDKEMKVEGLTKTSVHSAEDNATDKVYETNAHKSISAFHRHLDSIKCIPTDPVFQTHNLLVRLSSIPHPSNRLHSLENLSASIPKSFRDVGFVLLPKIVLLPLFDLPSFVFVSFHILHHLSSAHIDTLDMCCASQATV